MIIFFLFENFSLFTMLASSLLADKEKPFSDLL